MVNPYYGNLVWTSTYPTRQSRLKSLVVLQKRAMRIICRTSYQVHTAQLFLDLAILKIEQINEYLMGITMYRIDNKLMPEQFSQYRIGIQNVHEHYTRTSSNLFISYAHTNYRKFAVSLRGPVSKSLT